MKILIVMNYRPNRGGVTDQVLELIQELEKENVTFTIVSTHGRKINRIFNSFRALWIASRHDLVFGIGSAFWGFIPCIIASLAARLNRKPILFNFHDGQAQIFLDKYGKLVNKVIGKNKIVCATKFVANSFLEKNINAVNIPYHFKFEPNFYLRKKTFQWNKKVIWARSFYELYHPELALKAASMVLKVDSEFEFHFYGEGPMLEEMKNKYQQTNIIFHGFLQRSEFLKNYENFAIMINTTCYDNFPLSIVEAGYNELCVLSTRVGGIESIYSESELLFFKGENELAEKLLAVTQDYKGHNYFRFNLKKKVCTFTWYNVKADWLKLIKSSC